MKKLKRFTKRHRTPILIILGVILVALILALPGINRWRLSEAEHFAQIGEGSSNATQAALYYRYAHLLAPDKDAYTTALAEKYVRLDQVNAAITTLQQLPIIKTGLRQAQLLLASGQLDQANAVITNLIAKQPSAAAYTLKSRILLEQDKATEAVAAGESAVSLGVGDSANQFQLGLAYLIAGQTSPFATLLSTMSPSEGHKTLDYANTGKYPLAASLYASGLLRSADRALTADPHPNSETAKLTAIIQLTLYRYDTKQLQIGVDKLNTAVTANPANIDLRELLRQTYADLGDASNEAKQAAFLKQLRSGTP